VAAEAGGGGAAGEGAEGQLCVACLSEPRDTLLAPCRHVCLCASCAQQLVRVAASRNEVLRCPLCRSAATSLVPIRRPPAPAPAADAPPQST
jgi:hypothetical protein